MGANEKGRRGITRVSRRRAMVVAGAAAGGYFICPEITSSQHQDFNEFTGDRHACLELPVFNKNDSAESKSRSPTELAYMIQEDKLASAPAAAAQMASQNYPASVQSAPAKAAFANHWDLPDKVFRFFFMGTPRSLVDKVIAVAAEWTKYIDLKFDVVANAAQANVRVRCSRLVGHQSHIGIDAKREALGNSTMSLGFSDLTDFEAQTRYNEFVVLHEVGHALGLIHEHNRGDASVDFNRNATIAYFSRRGLNATQVQYNIFDRWNKPLIKSSAYDPLSIMHYMFPKEIMNSGQGTAQNYALSELDVQLAQEMYGAKEGRPTIDQPEKPVAGTGSLTATIDGEAARGILAANQELSVKFTVTADQGSKPFSIYSEGGTQVLLQLLGPNDASKGAIPADLRPGTYDLTNDVIQATLSAGEYVVKVRHVSQRGGGPVAVVVKSGQKFGNRLLGANRIGR